MTVTLSPRLAPVYFSARGRMGGLSRRQFGQSLALTLGLALAGSALGQNPAPPVPAPRPPLVPKPDAANMYLEVAVKGAGAIKLPPVAPPAGAAPLGNMEQTLKDFLNLKVQKNLIQRNEANLTQALYNGRTTQGASQTSRFMAQNAKFIVKDDELRAALFSLAGTAGYPAVRSALAGYNASMRPYASVAYDRDLQPNELVVPMVADNGTLSLRVNPRLKGQPLPLLGALMAGRIITHQDNVSSRIEETVAAAVSARIAADQYLADPELAKKPGLAQLFNTKLVALLNSGGPKGGIFEARQTLETSSIFPNGLKDHKSFEDYVRRENNGAKDDPATPGNPTLTATVKLMEDPETNRNILNDQRLANVARWLPINQAMLTVLDRKLLGGLADQKIAALKETLKLQEFIRP